MTLPARYQELYAYEKDSNDKMLTMIESVPEPSRSDPRFQQAVSIAAHLVANRENWLIRLRGDDEQAMRPWFETDAAAASLRSRYAAAEQDWSEYLSSLTEEELASTFDLEPEYGITWHREGQIFNLVTHACYHRGQIALLVDQLGGGVIDTDYAYWANEGLE